MIQEVVENRRRLSQNENICQNVVGEGPSTASSDHDNFAAAKKTKKKKKRRGNMRELFGAK